jgi:hypothetical protein
MKSKIYYLATAFTILASTVFLATAVAGDLKVHIDDVAYAMETPEIQPAPALVVRHKVYEQLVTHFLNEKNIVISDQLLLESVEGLHAHLLKEVGKDLSEFSTNLITALSRVIKDGEDRRKVYEELVQEQMPFEGWEASLEKYDTLDKINVLSGLLPKNPDQMRDELRKSLQKDLGKWILAFHLLREYFVTPGRKETTLDASFNTESGKKAESAVARAIVLPRPNALFYQGVSEGWEKMLVKSGFKLSGGHAGLSQEIKRSYFVPILPENIIIILLEYLKQENFWNENQPAG